MAEPTVQELQAELQKAKERLATVPDAAVFTDMAKRLEAAENETKVLKAKQEEETKRADEMAKAAKIEKDKRELVEYTNIAKADFGGLSGEDAEKGRLLKSLRDNLPPEDADAVVKMLKAGSDIAKSLTVPVGTSAPGEGSAQGKIDALAKTRAAEKGIHYAVAKSQITRENPELYQQSKDEQRRAN